VDTSPALSQQEFGGAYLRSMTVPLLILDSKMVKKKVT
jgi:hypothetical protein